jgi:hypothetical protein
MGSGRGSLDGHKQKMRAESSKKENIGNGIKMDRDEALNATSLAILLHADLFFRLLFTSVVKDITSKTRTPCSVFQTRINDGFCIFFNATGKVRFQGGLNLPNFQKHPFLLYSYTNVE